MSWTASSAPSRHRRRRGLLRRAIVSAVAGGTALFAMAAGVASPASGVGATAPPDPSATATPSTGVPATPSPAGPTTTARSTPTTVAVPPTTHLPPIRSATPAPLPTAPAPGGAAPAPGGAAPAAGGAPSASQPAASAVDPAQLLRLLEESAARRRHVDGPLAVEEAKLAQLTEELNGTQVQLAGARAVEQTAWVGLALTLAELDQRQAELVPLSAAATRARRQDLFRRYAGTCAVGASPATWLGARPMSTSPSPSEPGAGPPAPAIVGCGANAGKPSTPSKPIRALQGAVARRDQLRRDVGSRRAEWVAAQTGTEFAADAVSVKTQAVEAQRQALAALRESLAAALQDPGSQTGALAGGRGVDPSALARTDVPPAYLDVYRRAATSCPGLSWTVLAAIGKVESDHGRSTGAGVRTGANGAGAMGPMQFLGGTWSAYGADGNGDGVRDVYQPADAVAGAAAYLCANGGGNPARLPDAIWAYNHADWYVDQVLVQALSYGTGGLVPVSPPVDAATLVANRNVTVSPDARSDLLAGRVDPRVVAVLAAVAADHRITVGTLKTGHSEFVSGTDRVSNHFYGRAVDITAVDGAPVTKSNDAALDLALAVLTADPAIRPDELGSPWPELGAFRGAFSDADHQDHLHLGWKS